MNLEKILLGLSDIDNSIDGNLLPIIPNLKKQFANTQLRTSYLKRFSDEVSGGANTVGDGVGLIESYLNNVKDEVKLLKKYVSSNTSAIENSSTKLELIKDSIQNLSGVVLFSSDLLTSIFLQENVPPAKTQEMLKGLKVYSSLFVLIKETDIVDTIDNVPAGLSRDMISGFLGSKNMLGISGFNGNIFYSIGKYIKQWEHKKMKLLEERTNYLKLELLALELKDPSTNKKLMGQIKYHKENIQELETEIATLQD